MLCGGYLSVTHSHWRSLEVLVVDKLLISRSIEITTTENYIYVGGCHASGSRGSKPRFLQHTPLVIL
jgi:hypothetical protein